MKTISFILKFKDTPTVKSCKELLEATWKEKYPDEAIETLAKDVLLRLEPYETKKTDVYNDPKQDRYLLYKLDLSDDLSDDNCLALYKHLGKSKVSRDFILKNAWTSHSLNDLEFISKNGETK